MEHVNVNVYRRNTHDRVHLVSSLSKYKMYNQDKNIRLIIL